MRLASLVERMQSVDMTPLSKWQRSVLYWLDDALRDKPGRSIVVHNATIARDLGTIKRRVIAATHALEKKGYVKVTARKAPHGGWDANEYLVMPANPRKKAQVEQIAAALNQRPLDVLGYVSRLHILYESNADIGNMTLRELADALQYRDGTQSRDIVRFIDACREAGLSIGQSFVW